MSQLRILDSSAELVMASTGVAEIDLIRGWKR